jgi:hypothetical protein
MRQSDTGSTVEDMSGRERISVCDLTTSRDSQRERVRKAAEAATAVLCAYAASLGILGIAEAVGGASVETSFERGHSAVSCSGA